MTTLPRLLVIAGSDSGGGAGIQADIKTACALGVYAMTAVTAVTAQDTTGVHSVHLLPVAIVRDQISCCLSDIGADAIKIGMLGSAEIAAAVAEVLEREASGIPIVLDPVLASTNGTPLLDEPGVNVLRERLIPLSSIVTPNIPEAEVLTGIACETPADIRRAGNALLAMRAKAVLIKGGHRKAEVLVDTLFVPNDSFDLYHPRKDTVHTHGSGCTYAAAIAANLAKGGAMADVVDGAHNYVREAIETAPGLGRGHGPLNHMWFDKNS